MRQWAEGGLDLMKKGWKCFVNTRPTRPYVLRISWHYTPLAPLDFVTLEVIRVARDVDPVGEYKK